MLKQISYMSPPVVRAPNPGDRNRALLKLMNAQELHQCAPRLSQSNCAYVTFDNGDRGIIVSPGVSGRGAPRMRISAMRRYCGKGFDRNVLSTELAGLDPYN